MKGQKSKKSMFLFEQHLNAQQIKSLLEEDQELLKKLLSYCGKVYQKEMKKNHNVNIFLQNYKSIMKSHSSTFANVFSVNICIHFALLCSQNLLKEHRQNEGKALLKEAIEYAQIQGTDPMLLAVSYSNLAHLHYKHGKLYKALMIGLQGIEVVQNHIEELRIIQARERIVQDVVVFVNLLSIVQKSLTKILKSKDRQDLRVLYKNVNRLGYNYSLKYLGQDSIFTKKFNLPEESILLPLYQSMEFSEVHAFPDQQFEMKLADQLENIYKKLAELNLQPEVFYIRQNLVKSKQSILSSIQLDLPYQNLQPQPQYQVHYCIIFFINDEEMSISILKDFSQLRLPNQNFLDFVGHIEFKTTYNKNEIVQRIHKDKFQKILACLNTNDVVPYQLQVKKMNSDQFCRRIFVNFIRIDQKKRVEIHHHSIGILEPFMTLFCKEKVLIFVNHVCFNKFRIAICPSSTYQTIYLNVYLNQMEKYVSLTEMQNQKIKIISEKYNKSNQMNQQYFNPTKIIRLLDVTLFKGKIEQIIKQFQQFVQEIESQMITEMSSLSHYVQQPPFYLYNEESQSKATLMQLKYRANVNHIEVYLENVHQTHIPNGLGQAKGSSLYSPQNFVKDFSFGMKFARKSMQAFLNIIAQRYTLKTYNQPIEEHEEDRFQQNAIQQIQLNSKFYKRKFIQFEDYMLPVNLELISIKNQKPVGIKVSAYEPIKCVQTGVFIYLIPEYWQNSHVIQEKQGNENEVESENRHQSNQFQFQRKYFIANWLKEEGFDLIFSKIVIVNRSLQLKGINRKFCSLQEII